MSEEYETRPVYWHDCKALGKNKSIIQMTVTDKGGDYILYTQHKCPFCRATAGEKVYARGVTPTNTGYDIDTSIAEKLHSVEDERTGS